MHFTKSYLDQNNLIITHHKKQESVITARIHIENKVSLLEKYI